MADPVKKSAEPVDPLAPAAPSAPPRKTVTPTQGISYGEPVYDEDGKKVEQTTKFMGRDIKAHAHDIKHLTHSIPVSLPLAVAEELLKRGLATEPNAALDNATMEQLQKVRENAWLDPHTHI